MAGLHNLIIIHYTNIFSLMEITKENIFERKILKFLLLREWRGGAKGTKRDEKENKHKTLKLIV